MVGEVRVAHSLPWASVDHKVGISLACTTSSHSCLLWASPGQTLEGGLSLSCSGSGDNQEKGNGQNWQSAGWQLSGLPVSPVRYSGGREKSQGRSFEGKGYKLDPEEWL